jgi:tRNA/tmRNA/rRNA uracil-C5-methylase (TrmA/RlmC/RlmD family)
VGVSQLENGKKVLIKGALPDSIVDVRIVKKKKDYLT